MYCVTIYFVHCIIRTSFVHRNRYYNQYLCLMYLPAHIILFSARSVFIWTFFFFFYNLSEKFKTISRNSVVTQMTQYGGNKLIVMTYNDNAILFLNIIGLPTGVASLLHVSIIVGIFFSVLCLHNICCRSPYRHFSGRVGFERIVLPFTNIKPIH